MLRVPLSAQRFVGVLCVGVVAMKVRTALHRAVVPKKQDAFRT